MNVLIYILSIKLIMEFTSGELSFANITESAAVVAAVSVVIAATPEKESMANQVHSSYFTPPLLRTICFIASLVHLFLSFGLYAC